MSVTTSPGSNQRRVVVLAEGQPWANQIGHAIGLVWGHARVEQDPLAGPAKVVDADIVVAAIAERRGLSLLRELRDQGAARPAILAVAREGNPLLGLALGAGADDCLVLPASGEELQMRLSVVANRRRLDAEAGMLRRIAVGVASGFDHHALCDLVARELAQLLGADGGRVVEFTGGARAALLGAWRRSDFEEIERGTMLRLAPTWALAQVQRTGTAARSELTAADAAVARAPLRASLAAPVYVDGAIWGAVAVAYADPASAHEAALVQLERVAELVSLAVANAEAAKRLSRMASTDPLTGLVNHRVFHERLAHEVARMQRSPSAVSIAIIDLDHFKLVNDEHGHSVGDEALRIVARVLQRHARDVDVVGRVGGEEIAWLMPGASLEGALAAAERARQAVASEPVPVAGSVTASIGVAQLGPGMSAATLFDLADGAMYGAKHAGRDCVRVSALPSCPL